jgi:hypothetical protein
MKRLSELVQLPDNWDGYGSPRLQPAVVSAAFDLLRTLSAFHLPSPELFPVSGGGLQFEWQADKCELEIEVLPEGLLEFLIVDAKGEMREGRLLPSPLLSEHIYRLVHWFRSGQPSVVLL